MFEFEFDMLLFVMFELLLVVLGVRPAASMMAAADESGAHATHSTTCSCERNSKCRHSTFVFELSSDVEICHSITVWSFEHDAMYEPS